MVAPIRSLLHFYLLPLKIVTHKMCLYFDELLLQNMCVCPPWLEIIRAHILSSLALTYIQTSWVLHVRELW